MSLQAFLDAGQNFDAEFGAGLSNHMPMALAALTRLGADDLCLARFAQSYGQRLRPAPAAQDWPAGHAWRSRLGEAAAWPAYRNLFLLWLLDEGAEPVLRAVLPVLMQGCSAAAFHGLIRTAYAVQSGHGRELADGLAHWASRWADLGPPSLQGPVADPWPLLKTMAAPAPPGNLIQERMQQVVFGATTAAPFDHAVAQLHIDDKLLPRLARLAARLYARSGNFTVLHLVTSAHAVRVLLPFIDEPLPAMAAYWRALAAGFVASGALFGRASQALPWPELVAAALASPNDHLIKLVHSCREEQQAWRGADDWQRAASRAVAQARTPERRT